MSNPNRTRRGRARSLGCALSLALGALAAATPAYSTSACTPEQESATVRLPTPAERVSDTLAGSADKAAAARAVVEHTLPADASPAELRRVRLCGPPLTAPPDPSAAARRGDPETPVILEAEQIEGEIARGLYRLRGETQLRRFDQLLRTEVIDLDDTVGQASLPQRFFYTESGLQLWGRIGEFDLGDDHLEVEGAEFRFYPYHHGTARTLRTQGPGRVQIGDLRYSSCPPDTELWWLHAGELTLDRDSGLAQARHARLEIGGIPWLYTPYLQFPIDDRPRTGFLPPRFGQSTSDGAHITVPFYWRPAPNYDWTLYPTYYSRRGTQLGSQFRYLRPRTDGEWIVEYMPEDEVQAKRLRDAGESDPESERWALDWTHSGRVPTVAGLRYDLEVARVGDVDYLRDFSTELIGTSASELESRGHAALDRGPHRLEAEIQHWQNLRPQANDPYRRWPRLHYEHAPGRIAGGLEYRLTGEMVHWALPDGAQNDRPTGRRYHLQPRISWPYYRPGYFLEPGVSLYHTHYVLDRVEPELESELSRSVPIATLDGGLFFERPFTFRDDLFLQTLEPRLFYVRAPFEAQDEYPVFDTTRRADSVAQLFQENRFAGIDRVGDANQLTLALTTRLLDLNRGREPLRASIGQIHYFSDREVGLTAAREEQRSRSDLFADLEARIDDEFRLRLEQRYDPRHNETVAWSLVADWQRRPIPGSVVNLGYRIREEATGLDADDRPIVERTQEMFQLSAAAPIGPNWNAVGAWQYSRLDRANLEIVGGLEFRKCCWAVRGVARRYRRGAEYELENTFMLEFELTGLGRLGDDTAAFLGEIVRDYDDAVF